MIVIKKWTFCALALTVATTTQAQPVRNAPMFSRIAAPAQPSGAIPLYAEPAPGPAVAEVWDNVPGAQVGLRNVTRPTITPFLPAAGKGTGAAIIVAPGGGFQMLAMESEGWKIARWFADHGVAAFVLKYRIAPTPADEAAMMKGMMTSMAGLMTDPEKTMAPLEPPALADALQAIKLVRAGAAKWQVDPARVGMIGFSAGAMLTRDAALASQAAARPSFVGEIYGPMTAVTVPADAPPLFTALALDDPLFGRQGFGIVAGWQGAHRPVELHAYEKGGHGFGAGAPGTTSTMVLPEFLAWMEARGLLIARH
jgi:acetyl esterase/lipase